MKLRLITIFLIFGAFFASLAGIEVARADTPPVVSIRDLPEFSDVDVQLQALVNSFGFHSINHFCIITYGTVSDKFLTPVVYWPTQNKLIEWGVGSALILGSDHYSDLTRDILPDGMPTIDYWHRSEANDVIRDCHARGDKFTITRTAGGWTPINKIKQFSTIKLQLQDFADNNAFKKLNKFCVIGQLDGKFLGAYVYWLTGDKLIFWYPRQQDWYVSDALTDSNVQIDLKQSLRGAEDAKDDRNEMQRSYADGILKECVRSGQSFTITKSRN